MRSPAFSQGLVVAIILAVAGGVSFTLLTPFLGAGFVIRLTVAGLAWAYVVYLVARSGHAVGRVTVATASVLVTALAWWLLPTLTTFVLAHVLVIWIVRSLYYHSGLLSSLADLALTFGGVLLAVWASARTGSVFLATWSFFLVQALFTAIPQLPFARTRDPEQITTPDRFETASREAEKALRQLASR